MKTNYMIRMMIPGLALLLSSGCMTHLDAIDNTGRTADEVNVCRDTPEGRAELTAFTKRSLPFSEIKPDMQRTGEAKYTKHAVAADNTPLKQTLGDGLAQAMDFNKRLKAAHFAEDAATQRYIRAQRAFLPSASASLSYGPKHQFREGTGDADLEEKNASLRITQDIWTGGRHRYDRVREKHNLKDTRFRRYSEIRTLAADIVSAHMRLYIAQTSEALFLQSKQAVEHILRAERSRYRSGYGTRTDVVTAKARLADISARINDVLGEAHISRVLYARLTGASPDQKTIPVLPSADVVALSARQARVLVLRCHPDISSARSSVDVAEANIKRQKAELFPSLQMEASVNYREGADIFSRGEIRDESLLANLNVPIFNKGIEYTAIREARAEHARAQSLLEDTELELQSAVTDLFYRASTAKSTLTARLSGERSAMEVFYGVKKERGSGRRSAADVLEAETALLDARIATLRATGDYITAAKQLEFLTKGYGESLCKALPVKSSAS